jgi:hypothetical protein
LKIAGGKYIAVVKFIRENKMEPKLFRPVLEKAGMKKSRISELTRIASLSDKEYELLADGKIAFRAAYKLTMERTPPQKKGIKRFQAALLGRVHKLTAQLAKPFVKEEDDDFVCVIPEFAGRINALGHCEIKQGGYTINIKKNETV